MKHTSKEELIERFRAKFKNKNVIIPEPILVFRDMYAEQTDGHVIGLRYNYHKKEIQAYVDFWDWKWRNEDAYTLKALRQLEKYRYI